jgi:hypothetical protein
MHIQFFDDPLKRPGSREDVRILRLGFYVYPDRRRVAVGFELTRFIERPSLEIELTNSLGEPAGTLTVIEALEPNFTLTVHLRDTQPADEYAANVVLYYTDEPGAPRQVVQQVTGSFPAEPGEYLLDFGEGQP